MFSLQDIKVYEIGPQSIPIKSILTFNSNKYEFVDVADRDKDGNFTWYWARRVHDPA